MTARNFGRCFDLTIKHEGGYADHPRDPGGATNLGVTIGTLREWRWANGNRLTSKDDVRALTVETVKPIYRANYWDAIKGDALPAGVDFVVYDFGVNSGPLRAIMALQRAAGVADDGKLGRISLDAIAAADPRVLIDKISRDRLAFLKRLSTFPTFGKGWTRRVAETKASALAMTE